LERDDCKLLDDAWCRAPKDGYPFNAFITIRPPNNLTPIEYVQVVNKFWNRLGVWSRRHTPQETFHCILVREAAPNGKNFGIGEHFHAVVHVPPGHFNSLKTAVESWHPEPGEAVVRRADHSIRRSPQGKIRSILGYLTKQRSPRAWYLTNYTRQRGGKVLGKRYRISESLRAKPMGVRQRHQGWSQQGHCKGADLQNKR
jgi:hypothetical protein